jgi:hypothetical protein
VDHGVREWTGDAVVEDVRQDIVCSASCRIRWVRMEDIDEVFAIHGSLPRY